MTSAARKAWNDAMKATAGASALPPALQQRHRKRRSDRNKKQERRTKARKAHELGDTNDDFRMAVWIDALEDIDPAAPAPEDDEEYDELDDLEDRSRKKRKSHANKAKAGVLPKRFMARSLASILTEEANRSDGISREFVFAQSKLERHQQLPRRKFCPVTGLFGIYTEPKSRIPYASMKALEQIQERSPPWMTLGGSAAYSEAVKSIEDMT